MGSHAHTQELRHTHSLQTQSCTGTSTQPHSLPLSAGLHLLLIPTPGAAWTQSRSLSRRALCSGTWRGAEPGWGDGLRDCTTLTRSGVVLAQEEEPRGTQAWSRQTALGARCPRIAMARPLQSLPLLGCTTGVSALCARHRQVCSCVHKRQKSLSSI